MANDRMWLVHKPSGEKSLIAKNRDDHWDVYDGPKINTFQQLFDQYGCVTDYVIEYESET